MEYKDTLNLPETAFPMKANLNQREPEILAKWEKENLYSKIMTASENKPLYILHDGPPYANGHIHIGHALNKILKDIVLKSKRMSGFHAPYVPGWDCHGLPIELQVEKNLGSKKHQISKLEMRKLCREYAAKFVDIQKEEFKRLGILGDWDNPYLTMNYEYEGITAARTGQIRRTTAGSIKGKKPVHWCSSCVTALAEAEVEYADHKLPLHLCEISPQGRHLRRDSGTGREKGLRGHLDHHPLDPAGQPGYRPASRIRLCGAWTPAARC